MSILCRLGARGVFSALTLGYETRGRLKAVPIVYLNFNGRVYYLHARIKS